MSTQTRRDRARLLRCQPSLETLERRDLLSWSPQLVAVTELEPNDIITQAQDVGPIDFAQGVRVAGAIGVGTDVDFYQFELDEATDITVKLSGTGIASLYANDALAVPLGHPLLLQLNAGATQAINLLPGTYEVAVSGLGDRYFSPVIAGSGTDGTTGPYALSISGDNPTFDPNAPLPIVRTDIPAGGYTGSPLALNITVTQPPDLRYDYITIVDASQNDYSPTVTYDADAHNLVITPVSPLDRGKYQVVGYDSTGNQLFALPFAVHGNGSGAALASHDTIATATPLSNLTHAGLVQVAGALGTDPYYLPWNSDPDGTNPANQVEMYSFTVSGPGRYVLSAETFAGRIGSPLDPALTLFRVDGKNADGTPAWQLLAGNDNSYNPLVAADGTAPLFTDPALFAGLTAGHYVIAVSATGNYADPLLGMQPGVAGWFDPDRTHSGSADTTTTGPYVLNLLVQPASPTPPTVVTTSIAAGDVLSGPPTQLTVQFSLPVDLVQLAVLSGQQWRLDTFSGNVDPTLLQRFPVYVLDDAGQRHILALSSYDNATGIASFSMLDRLTDGNDTLHLSGPGGLTDLAGNPLVGNDPSGDYVVPFTVTDSPAVTANRVLTQVAASAAAPTDLGVLFPTELAAGLSVERAAPATPNHTDYYQFTLAQDTGLELSLGGAGLNVAGRPVLLDAQGNPLYSAINPQRPDEHFISLVLHAGTYVVAVDGGNGAGGAAAVYTLNIVQDSLPENPTPLTTGPAPAFQLRLDTLATSPPSSSVFSSAGATPQPTPQLTLPSPGTPSITLTVDRSGASSVLPGATPLMGVAAGLATGPAGVVGNPLSASSAPVRLVLPDSEFPATAVSTTADLLAPLSTSAHVDQTTPAEPLAEPPAVATTASMYTGHLAHAVSTSLHALLVYSLDWMRLSPSMAQPLYWETNPSEAVAATEEPAALDRPTVAASADNRNIVAAVWAAGLGLLACVGAEQRVLARRRAEAGVDLKRRTPERDQSESRHAE